MIILCSIFYSDGWSVICPSLKNIVLPFKLLINIWIENEDKHKIYNEIKTDYPDAVIIFSTNVGKDIGGKLALMDLSLRLSLKSEFYILLHDKKSPHSPLGNAWRNKLFRIIEPNNIELIRGMFLQQKKLGIVAAKEFIKNEYDSEEQKFDSTSNQILKSLLQQYDFNISNFDFVGGTMFWVRAEVFNDFFIRYAPLDIRAGLEKGNVLDNEHGSQTHAWERVFSWIAARKEYKIKGI